MQAALNAENITAIGIGTIVVLVIVGFLIGLVITAIIGRLLLALIVVVAAILVWTQRTAVEHKIGRHDCNLSFFGVHLDPPQSIRKNYCDVAHGGNG